RWMTLVYTLIFELLAIPVLLLWPDLYNDFQKSTLFQSVPIHFLKRIAEGVSDKNEQIAFVNWAAVMLFFRSVNLVGIAGAVLFGTALFARERETQTLEFLLARPVSRTRVLWQKSWPTALALIVPIFLVNWSAIYWSRLIDYDLPFAEVTLACVHGAAFVLMFLGFTTWMSVRCRTQAHVAFWVGGITIVMLGLYMTQRIRPFSLFRLSDFEWYGPILAGNVRLWQMLDPTGGPGSGFTTWVLLGVIAFYLLAWRALRRLEL
ncbi:MAG: ABC transporter permease subunit, partial [Planctomycetes bacterium]|nr:ABC transporter permease subunit [Planctomycetota bacterium]